MCMACMRSTDEIFGWDSIEDHGSRQRAQRRARELKEVINEHENAIAADKADGKVPCGVAKVTLEQMREEQYRIARML